MTPSRASVLRRLLPGCTALALVGLVLAGCGGSSKAGGAAGAAGTSGRAAQAFPSTTVAFVDANIDASSDAWKRLLVLGARFPSFPKLVADFNASANGATGAGPTLSQVRAWLGSEVAIGVLDVPVGGGNPDVLGFAEVRDRASLEAQVRKQKDTSALGTHGAFDLFKSGKDSLVLAISDDTALIGSTQPIVVAGIDRLASSSDRLADDTTFKDTLATLPSDNIAVAYAPGAVLQKLVALAQKRDPTQRAQSVTSAQMSKITAQLQGIRSLGFSLDATADGLRTRTTALLNGNATSVPDAYTPDLLGHVPANAWFAASFGDLGTNAKSASDQAIAGNPSAQKQVAQVEALLGIKLDDVYALLAGENALYAGPGAPVSAGLVMHPADAAKGALTLRALTRALATQGIKFDDTADGQSALIQGFAARWRAVGDNLAIGTDAAVGNAVKDSIVDSEKFKRVLAEDGVDGGAKTLGLAYIDVPSLINVATAFGAFYSDSNSVALDNLKHVGGVLFWTGRNGDTVTSDVFVEGT
ncbi:MAG: hypothetical protein QOI71_516 [Gaiellales bacterium]|nr:hypothetical protein [Gaiellales bacterium]